MKDIDGIERALEILKPHWSEIEKDFERHNARYLALSAANHDVIGRVLKAHLVVESFIDGFLRDFYTLPDVESVRLSFFQKASLLPASKSGASYVKPGILQLNSVRNKYGHHLEFEIETYHLSAVYEVLRTARAGQQFSTHIEAIEAFAAVACAFLSLPPKHLQDQFAEAFSELTSHLPDSVAEEIPLEVRPEMDG